MLREVYLTRLFGIDAERTAKQLSEREVSYLHEYVAFEALRLVGTNRQPPAANKGESK